MNYGSVLILKRATDQAVLMQLRDNKPGIAYPNHYALPSGGAEGDETPEETVIREILEETGYILNSGEAELLFTAPQKIRDREIIRSVFKAIYDGVQPIQCFEGQLMRFVLPEELSTLNVFSYHLGFIQRMQEMENNTHPERR